MLDEIKIIKKVVSSYTSRDSRLDFEDLCSEAYLAYLEAAPAYNPSRAKKSTFIWTVVRNRLNSILAKKSTKSEIPTDQEVIQALLEGEDQVDPGQTVIAEERWQELMDGFSPGAKVVVCFLVNNGEVYFDVSKPRQARGIIARELRRMGWPEEKIWNVFREIKQAVKKRDEKAR